MALTSAFPHIWGGESLSDPILPTNVNSTGARTDSLAHIRQALGTAADQGCRSHAQHGPLANGLERAQQLIPTGVWGACSIPTWPSCLSWTPRPWVGLPRSCTPSCSCLGRSPPLPCRPGISRSTSDPALTTCLTPGCLSHPQSTYKQVSARPPAP